MIALSLPIMLYLLVGVVLIEAWCFRRVTRASWKRSLSALGKANLITTLIGFPLTWIVFFAWEYGMFLAGSSVADRFKSVGAILDRVNDNTIPGKIVMGILGAPWLGPTNSKLTITVAFLALLVPAFFVSSWIEGKLVMRSGGWDASEAVVKRTVWRANCLSYLFLAVVGAAILNLQLRR